MFKQPRGLAVCVRQAASPLIFNGLDEGTQKFIIGAVLLAGVLKPILSIGKTLLGGLGSFMGIAGGLPSLLTGVTGGFTGMGLAMNALPVLAIVAGIVAIGGSLLWLANNADEVKTIVSEDLNAMVSDYQAKSAEAVEIEHAASVAKVAELQSARAAAKEIQESIVADERVANLERISVAQTTLAVLKATWSAGLATIVASFRTFSFAVLGNLTTWGSNMKDKASSVLDNVRSSISFGVDKIRSLFNFSWSLPHIRLPHFNISGSFSLMPPSVPRISVAWYAKGGILNGAQIFGAMGRKLLGGGEAGPEAVLPLSSFYGELRNILASFLGGSSETDLTGLYDRLDNIYDRLGRLQVVLDTGVLVGETVDQYDAALAERQLLAERGV